MNKPPLLLITLYSSLLVSTLLLCFDAQAGKKHCKTYLEKLQNIQSQQRAGYSLKQGNKLEKRAEKAREKWWNCERGLTVVKKGSSKKKKSLKMKRPSKKETIYLTNQPSTKLTPFATSKSVVIKGQYQGKQQQAWLAFYQQPKKCFRPKTTQAFAHCVENKREQSEIFEQKYPK